MFLIVKCFSIGGPGLVHNGTSVYDKSSLKAWWCYSSSTIVYIFVSSEMGAKMEEHLSIGLTAVWSLTIRHIFSAAVYSRGEYQRPWFPLPQYQMVGLVWWAQPPLLWGSGLHYCVDLDPGPAELFQTF